MYFGHSSIVELKTYTLIKTFVDAFLEYLVAQCKVSTTVTLH